MRRTPLTGVRDLTMAERVQRHRLKKNLKAAGKTDEEIDEALAADAARRRAAAAAAAAEQQRRQWDEFCTRLANDQAVTVVDGNWLPPLTDERAQQLSEALKRNTVVEELTLRMSYAMTPDDDGTRGLATFIGRSPSLRTLKLGGFGYVADELLVAAGRNPKLMRLEIDCRCGIRGLVSSFQGLTHSLKTLTFWDSFAVVVEDVPDVGQHAVFANALRGLASLEELNVRVSYPTLLVTTIISAMRGHPCLKELRAPCFNRRGGVADSVHAVLQSETPLERLSLIDLEGRVPRALYGHQTLRELQIRLQTSGEEEENSAQDIANLLRVVDGVQITKLEVDTKSLQTATTILQSLVGDGCTLRELHLCYNGGSVGSPQEFWTTLANDIIPGLAPQLKVLQFLELVPRLDQAHSASLVEAFKNNTSLTKVGIRNLDAASAQAVRYFGKRNECRPLQAALKNPDSTTKKPRMLTFLEKLHAECVDDDVTEVSVIYDTLRDCVDVFARSSVWKPAKLSICDGFSILRQPELEHIDLRLEEITENEEEFGGLGILLVGDPGQLPAIGSPTLPDNDELSRGSQEPPLNQIE